MRSLINATSGRTPLPDNSIHLAITSPPYWGLRRYSGLEPQIFGGDRACQHEWGDEKYRSNSTPRDHDGAYAFANTRGKEDYRANIKLEIPTGQFCQKCGT